MKKKDLVTLILGVIGGMLFALGMCMTMLPKWNAFNQGIVLGIIGVVVLLVDIMVRRKMEGKAPIKFNLKTVLTVIFGIVSVIVFGLGMCMTMLWDNYMILGIVVGMVGIAMLICLIPMAKGIIE